MVKFWLNRRRLGELGKRPVTKLLPLVLTVLAGPALAEDIRYTCGAVPYDAEVTQQARYHLRSKRLSGETEAYSVFDAKTNCSFLLEPIDQQRDHLTLWRFSTSTIPLQYVRARGLRVPRFLSNKYVQRKIMIELAESCPAGQSRSECEDQIEAYALENAAMLKIRRDGQRVIVDIFDGKIFQRAN